MLNWHKDNKKYTFIDQDLFCYLMFLPIFTFSPNSLSSESVITDLSLFKPFRSCTDQFIVQVKLELYRHILKNIFDNSITGRCQANIADALFYAFGVIYLDENVSNKMSS